ncbi:hypothetical protein MACJ_002673 [Theileria orientalis]|uniref:Uncharacterized protein n=1 Tax=Theileria orientalis TaxID=68886 RepID=A0A976QVN0_THEOR|nr:hypothetical protein MACJ_002673 [Theileria orientalis]
MSYTVLTLILLLSSNLAESSSNLRKHCKYEHKLFSKNHNNTLQTAFISSTPKATHELWAKQGQRQVLNKKDLVNQVAEKLNKTQKEVNTVVDEFLLSLKKHLSRNSQVNLAKFGVFKNSLRGERRMRNLQTGQIFTAKPVYVPNLRFYDTFKQDVNRELSKRDHPSYNY